MSCKGTGKGAERGNRGQNRRQEKEDKADEKKDEKPKDIVVELKGIQDRILRLTPNSSEMGSAVISKNGETLYYFSAFEDKYDLWKWTCARKRPSYSTR